MGITKRAFGKTASGEAVELYTIANVGGASVSVITYGGAVQAIKVPDKNGIMTDVALGCDTIEDYEKQDACLGALIGRVGNRLKDSEFTLDGVSYKLYANDGKNHLHGGKIGYNKRVWSAAVNGDALELTLFSPDGEENYPGNLQVKVVYALSDDNALSIDYTAVTDKATPVNLTNHSYFNLSGEAFGTVLDNLLRLNCDNFVENSDECLPTGRILPVEGTPLDFKSFHKLGERINDDDINLKNCGGYDHTFVVNRRGGGAALAGELYSEHSGILMKTLTTKPGVQLYTGNFMNNLPAKGGRAYNGREGVCLETQFYPNAMKCDNFPNIVLRPGESYRHTTIFKFEVKETLE